jgi:hypothetical protein
MVFRPSLAFAGSRHEYSRGTQPKKAFVKMPNQATAGNFAAMSCFQVERASRAAPDRRRSAQLQLP